MVHGGVLEAGWYPLGNFVASVILPNIPQLLLSFAYFAYNALYTRLLAESEWQSFSTGYRPLRVTHPQGEQCSTHRLQLPYRYSIPLLITSILLHWITSNAIFFFMSEGGKSNLSTIRDPYLLFFFFWPPSRPVPPSPVYRLSAFRYLDIVLPPIYKYMNAKGFAGYYSRLDPRETSQLVMLVGYSSPAIVIGFTLSLFLTLLPLVLGSTRLRGSMVISRSNSMIMSAACHVSTLRKAHSGSSGSRLFKWDRISYDDDGRVVDPGAVGDADDWSRTATAAISAVVEGSIGMQPLVSESPRQSFVSSCSTRLSEEPRGTASIENIPNIAAGVSPENGPIINKQAAQYLPSPPTVHIASNKSANMDRDTRAASEDGRDVEEQPLLPSRSNRANINTDHLSQINNAASRGGTLYTARESMTEGDEDLELQCLITSPHTDGEHSRGSANSLEADDPDERLDAALRLEDGSNCEEEDMKFRLRLSRSRIRWGIVPMPEEFYNHFGDLGRGVETGHLSFGIEAQGVSPPVDSPEHVYI